MKKEALEGFINDVDGSEDQEAGLDEGGEIFEFAVAVRMALVGGPVGNADGEKGDDRGNKIEAGMEGLGKHAEAARADDQKGFQTKKEGGGADAEQGGAFLLLDGGVEALGKSHEVRLQQVRGFRGR